MPRRMQLKFTRHHIRTLLLWLLLSGALWFFVFRKSRVQRHGSRTPGASIVIKPRATVASAKQGHDIPRIIHQTWKTKEVPVVYLDWVKSWLLNNDDWEYWFWTDRDMIWFMAERYPQFLDLFQNYPEIGHRVDAFRYMSNVSLW